MECVRLAADKGSPSGSFITHAISRNHRVIEQLFRQRAYRPRSECSEICQGPLLALPPPPSTLDDTCCTDSYCVLDVEIVSSVREVHTQFSICCGIVSSAIDQASPKPYNRGCVLNVMT
jgi:hypothetical protein